MKRRDNREFRVAESVHPNANEINEFTRDCRERKTPLTRDDLIEALLSSGLERCASDGLDRVLSLIADAIDQAAGVTPYRVPARKPGGVPHVLFPLPIGMQEGATAASMVRRLRGETNG